MYIFTGASDTNREGGGALSERMNPPRVMILPRGIVMRSLLSLSQHFKEMTVEGSSAPASTQPKSNQKCILAARMQSSFLQPNLQQLLAWKCKYCNAIRKALSPIQQERDVKEVPAGACLFVLGPLMAQRFDLVLEYLEMLLQFWLSRGWNSTFSSFLHQKLHPPQAELGSSETGPFNHHRASQQSRLCLVEIIGKQIRLLCKCKWHKNSSPLQKKKRGLHIVVKYNFPLHTCSWLNSQHLDCSIV